jgi:hypothetical protein
MAVERNGATLRATIVAEVSKCSPWPNGSSQVAGNGVARLKRTTLLEAGLSEGPRVMVFGNPATGPLLRSR